MEYLKYFAGEAHLQQKLNYFPGLTGQTDTTTMAGLQNLAALAAMTAQTSALSSVQQPQQPSHNAQLSSAAALLCEYQLILWAFIWQGHWRGKLNPWSMKVARGYPMSKH